MKIYDESEVVEGEDYFVVCGDGVVRYLTVEFFVHQHGSSLTEFVFYDVHGNEQYRTHETHLIYRMG